MTRLMALVITFLLPGVVGAQLMLERMPDFPPGNRVRAEGNVPAAIAGSVSLRFRQWDVCFDGGSYGAFFQPSQGPELVLFFPHPGYWSAQAKRESKQPVAMILDKTVVEIAVDSPLQDRLLELLAHDLADGKRDRADTLQLIRVRDCLLNRKPLAKFTENYDPKTWQARPKSTDASKSAPSNRADAEDP